MSSSFCYSITLSSFRKILGSELDILENIVRIGFTNVEMFGEPDKIDLKYYKDIFSTLNVQVVGITGMWGKSSQEGWKRRLLSKDFAIKKHAENYVLSCIELCRSLGGRVFNVCLFSDPVEHIDVTHTNIESNRKKDYLKKIIPTLRMISNYGYDRNVKVVLEPLNRYSTPYCCNYQDTIAITEGCDKLYLMLDTFHMNIEEDVIDDVIIKSDAKLAHMHFAENNRKMPGEGHIDFISIIRSLKSIQYKGFISFEPTINERNFESQVKAGLNFIKNLESIHIK